MLDFLLLRVCPGHIHLRFFTLLQLYRLSVDSSLEIFVSHQNLPANVKKFGQAMVGDGLNLNLAKSVFPPQDGLFLHLN